MLKGLVELEEELVGGKSRGEQKGRGERRKGMIVVAEESKRGGGYGSAYLMVVEEGRAETIGEEGGRKVRGERGVSKEGWRG